MDISKIKFVKQTAGVGLMDAKKALIAASGDINRAIELARNEDRSERETGFSSIFSYNHQNRILGYVILACVTDFVGKTSEFCNLGTQLAQQVVGACPDSVEALLEQEYIRDSAVKVKDLVDKVSRETRETISVVRFHREQVYSRA